MGKLSGLSKSLDMAREARLARAREMGFDTSKTYYHGTGADIEEFHRGSRGGRAGDGVYFAERTAVPNIAAKNRAQSNGGNANVMPVYLRADNQYVTDTHGDDLLLGLDAKALEARGYTGVDVNNLDGDIVDRTIFDPANIRSVNATFDPAKKDSPNLLASATAAAVGLGAMGASDESEAGPIKVIDEVTGLPKRIIEAWHGSPHKFDKFSMDNIGTGEGAQAYGHGLYFADAKDTSKTYIPRDLDHEDWMYQQYKAAEDSGDMYAMEAWERAMQHEYPSDLRELAADPDYDEHAQEAYRAVADALEVNPPKGSLTKVHLDVDPDTLLDYDKPLSEQTPYVQEALARVGLKESATAVRVADELELVADNDRTLYEMGDEVRDLLRQYQANPNDKGVRGKINKLYREYTGENDAGDVLPYLDYLEDSMAGRDGGDFATILGANSEAGAADAARRLKEVGIPGIRYLDGDSRGAGAGTSNYVMFDDKPISIKERGMADPALLAATSTAAAAFMESRGERKAYWQARRADLLDAVNIIGQYAGIAVDTPLRAVMGVTGLAGSLAAGEGLDAAMSHGWQDFTRDSAESTYDMGGAVTDVTGSPELGAAVHSIPHVLSPL